MRLEVIEGNPVTFDIRPYLLDRGWSISDASTISHDSSQSGNLVYSGYPFLVNTSYRITLNAEVSSGDTTITLGGVDLTGSLQEGYNEFLVTTENSSPLTFWSNGDVNITNITITGVTNNQGVTNENDNTITWSEERKRWVSFRDYIPESGFSMFTNMFTFKNGNLWIHTEDNTTNNNFYGDQHYSTIKFPVYSVGVKTYHSIAVHANKIVGTTENGIETELGNVTDLITFDFTSMEGIHYANKLRDVILNEKLKGRYIVVELSDEETQDQKLQLFKIVLKGEISTPSE